MAGVRHGAVAEWQAPPLDPALLRQEGIRVSLNSRLEKNNENGFRGKPNLHYSAKKVLVFFMIDWQGYHERRDTYPDSCVTKYTSKRRLLSIQLLRRPLRLTLRVLWTLHYSAKKVFFSFITLVPFGSKSAAHRAESRKWNVS